MLCEDAQVAVLLFGHLVEYVSQQNALAAEAKELTRFP
jgi:hypothetical protein|eukprot:COSAG01_NODE_496_length_16290_cov_48.639244_4_plen_38_part_00